MKTTRLLTLLAGSAFTLSAHATILAWNNPLGGSAATAGNWNPSQLPVSSDDLTFALNAAYPVTYNAASNLSRTHTYRGGTVTISCSTTHSASTGLTIASLANDIADVTLTTGALSSAGAVTIGSANPSTGTLRVNDDDALLTLTGTADMTVGSNGAGTLQVTGGGAVSIADQFIAGNNATSVSNVTISGTSGAIPFTRSSLAVTGASQSRLGQGGDATVSIANGAIASFAGPVVISIGSNSTSTVTVGGTGGLGGLLRATLSVGTTLDLSKNTSAATAAGVSTLTVNSGGTVTCGGTINLAGDPDGGTATLSLNSGGIITTNAFVLGTGGTLDLNGGHLTIDGGSYSQTNGLQPVFGGPNDPVITLTNNASFSSASSVFIGSGTAGADLATFEVTAGADLTAFSSLNLGQGTSDSGDLTVSGVGSTVSCGKLTVGDFGTSSVLVDLGAQVSSTGSIGVVIAGNPGSTGTLTVQGASTLSTAGIGGITIGGTPTTQGGVGTLALTGGSSASTSGAITVWPGSAITLANSSITAASLELKDSTTITVTSGPCSIIAPFHGNPTSSIIATGGDLTIGAANHSLGYEGIGSLSVGNRTVTLLDASFGVIGNTSIAGGTLAVPNGVVLNPARTLSGFGTISGDLENSGIISPSGTGLRFNNTVTTIGGSIAGTIIGFNSGSEYAGNITIAADIDADPGSTIAPTGNLSLGRSTSASGCTLDGTFLCQNHAITLLDSNGVTLGSLTDLGTTNGIRLICTQNLSVTGGRTLQGVGTLQTPILSVSGDIKPGDTVFFGPNGTGTIHVDGRVSLTSSADYFCQIGDPIEGTNHDRITASLPIQVAGAIHASLEPGFTPNLGAFFDVFIGSSRTGTFAVEDCPGFFVTYLADRVRLTWQGLPCEADLNCDGNADQDDVNALISTIAGNPADFCREDPDINHDGNADQDDVLALINLIAGGPCP